jgi:hypothetical protein
VFLVVMTGFSCNMPSDVRTLRSGKQISVTNVSRIDFPAGDPALVMTYETKVPIDNRVELRKEADEVWEIFRSDVEVANLKAAAIRAVKYDMDSVVRSGKGYGFVFVKRPDGMWHCIDDENDPP